jgi:DNA-binding transcriptional regulator LsrR (DeoR family)
MHEQGMTIADIAKELGIGQGEIILILEMAGKR